MKVPFKATQGKEVTFEASSGGGIRDEGLRLYV